MRFKQKRRRARTLRFQPLEARDLLAADFDDQVTENIHSATLATVGAEFIGSISPSTDVDLIKVSAEAGQ